MIARKLREVEGMGGFYHWLPRVIVFLFFFSLHVCGLWRCRPKGDERTRVKLSLSQPRVNVCGTRVVQTLVRLRFTRSKRGSIEPRPNPDGRKHRTTSNSILRRLILDINPSNLLHCPPFYRCPSFTREVAFRIGEHSLTPLISCCEQDLRIEKKIEIKLNKIHSDSAYFTLSRDTHTGEVKRYTHPSKHLSSPSINLLQKLSKTLLLERVKSSKGISFLFPPSRSLR